MALARALVLEPDLLLLDEPTNHLDVAAIEWLEETLAAFAGAVLFVTHDRRFLDRVATRIVELDRGRLADFPGNFSAYEARKAELLAIEAVVEPQGRQGARPGRGVDPQGRGGAAHAQRGPRAPPRGAAPRARRAARAHRPRRPRARRGRALRKAGGRARGRHQALRRQARGGGLLHAHPARRQDRPHRAQRLRQDDAAQADPGRDRARRGHRAPGHQARRRLLRPVARAARRGGDARRHDLARGPTSSRSAARASTSSATWATSCSRRSARARR